MNSAVTIQMLMVFLGSALGGGCRFLLSALIHRHWRNAFPVGTLMVNVSGALMIGMVWALPWAQSGQLWRSGVILGFLGGYTTVSTFSLQTLDLMREGRWIGATTNVAASYLFCLTGVFAGSGMIHVLLA